MNEEIIEISREISELIKPFTPFFPSEIIEVSRKKIGELKFFERLILR